MTLRERIRLALLTLGSLCLAARPGAVAADENFFTHLHTDKAMANVTVLPAHAGPVDIEIQLETTDEKPLFARTVTVTLADTESGKRLPTVQAARAGDDSWHVHISSLAAGRWMLGLAISLSGADDISVEAPIQIER